MEKQTLEHLLYRISVHDDERAFSAFFDHYQPKLIKLALLFVPAYEQAQDVVSEVFIKLLRNRKSFHLIDRFDGYLYRAVKNQCLNLLKNQKSRTVHVPVEDLRDHLSSVFLDPFEKILESELRAVVADTIDHLPPKRQMVYRMIKDEKMTYREVSEILEIAERTVETHLKLAIRDLQKAIMEHYSEKQKSVPLKKWSGMRMLFF